jgi:S1-C subfamily serine protease
MSLAATVTKGIVSAHRGDDPATGEARLRLGQPLIQADVDIQGGNSGGPLLDARGNVVAICVSGLSSTPSGGPSIGINFFIPIGDALEKLNLLLESRKAARP